MRCWAPRKAGYPIHILKKTAPYEACLIEENSQPPYPAQYYLVLYSAKKIVQLRDINVGQLDRASSLFFKGWKAANRFVAFRHPPYPGCSGKYLALPFRTLTTKAPWSSVKNNFVSAFLYRSNTSLLGCRKGLNRATETIPNLGLAA